MKRLTSIFLILLLPLMAKAHDIAVANEQGVMIYYVLINETEVAVSFQGDYGGQYNEYTGEVIIPESVVYNNKTYSVTSIGNYAFDGCSDLTSITIPNRVTSIGDYAFNGCSNLVSITIPNSVTTIGRNAFRNCIYLSSIAFPKSVKTLDFYAFANCI